MADRLFDQLKIHSVQADTASPKRPRLSAVDLPKVSPPQPRPEPPEPSVPVLVSAPLAPASLAPAQPRPQPTRKRLPRKPSRWAEVAWSKVWLTLLLVCGGVGVGGFLLLTSLPPLPDCRKSPSVLPDAQQLYCARDAARSGDLTAILSALKLVTQWPEGHPLHEETQHLIVNWSNAVLRAAYQKIENNDFKGAVALAKQIPVVSPVYPDAQEAIASWDAEWKLGDSIFAKAQTALQQREWGAASAYVLDLGELEHSYWREQRSNQLTQQVIAEKEAWQAFRQAEKLAKAKTPEQLGQAIALVHAVPPTLMIWSTIEPKLNQWSQVVVTAALAQWQRGNREKAVALVKPIPPQFVKDAKLRGVVYLSQAQQLAEQAQNPEQPMMQRIYAVMEALSAVRQIAPDSPFHDQAQEHIALWQTQLDDLHQIQSASLLASVGQRQGFEAAIAAASKVGLDRPFRLQAQTLIADWQQQILRIEDMPKLRAAERLAERGKLADLQAAIAAAQNIPTDRPIATEVQMAIAQWQDKIEAIEDQPILDEAQTLARADKLTDAIEQASKIQQDRALYTQAQTLIADWQAKLRAIQIAEDQPILDEARALAARERLTLAIDKASQIGEGRALYPEAQAAIDQWVSDRAALWNQWDQTAPADSWEPEPAQPDSWDWPQ